MERHIDPTGYDHFREDEEPDDFWFEGVDPRHAEEQAAYDKWAALQHAEDKATYEAWVEEERAKSLAFITRMVEDELSKLAGEIIWECSCGTLVTPENVRVEYDAGSYFEPGSAEGYCPDCGEEHGEFMAGLFPDPYDDCDPTPY